MAGEESIFREYLEREGFTEEQSRAVLASGNLIVEAGAGTGKTKTLVARYLFHVLVEGFPPSRVVALTFTEKAAQEMKERVAQELSRFLNTPLRERALKAMEGVVHAPIKTFHGFAAHVLREYPVETGVDPAFSVLDELGEDLLLDEAINSYISAHLSSPHLSLLLSHWNIFQLRRALRLFFKRVVSENEWEEVVASVEGIFPPSDGLPPEVERLREVVSLKGEVQRLLAQKKWVGHFSRVYHSMEMLEYLLSLLSTEETLPVLIRLARELETFPSWGRCGYLRELAGTRDLSHGLWEWIEGELGRDFYEAFLDAARGVEDVFSLAKRREGVLTFSDLQRGLLRGLRRNEHLVEELKERFRRFLVDEYQDTNEFQREVVCRLCEERGSMTPRYQDAILEEGKLFIVGDPKQSIYAFRGGDVAVYSRTREQLGEEASLFLTRSFRSGASLVEAVNLFFERVFEPTEPLPPHYAVPFTPLSSPREGGEAWLWRLPRDGDYLEHMARLVMGIREERGRWGDVALLVRRNATAIELYRYLSELNIPVVSSTTGALEERREIQDILLYLRALDNPADDYSVAGVLLAPFVGVGNETLLALSASGKGLYAAWREAVERIPGEGAPRIEPQDLEALARGLEVFQKLMELKDRLTISGLIQEVVRVTGYGAWLSQQPWGRQALANVDRLARVARRFQKGRLFTLSEFLIYLDHWGLSSREVQEEVEGDNAVAILTVHAAKGLEFPVVVLAETWTPYRRNTDPVLYDPQGGLALRLPGLAFSPRYERVRRLKDAKGWEEEKRLLYVAFTRAREELHVVVKEKRPRGLTWHSLLEEGGIEDLAQEGKWDELPPLSPVDGEKAEVGGVLEPPLSLDMGEGCEVGVGQLIGEEEGDEKGLGVQLHRALKEILHPREAPRWYELNASSFVGTRITRGKFVKMIQTYFQSPLYKKVVSKGVRAYRELPLEAFYQGMRVKGRVDLLVVLPDGGMVLVDYKLSPSILYREAYRDQLALYAWLLERNTGSWPREAYLYSITTGTEEKVDTGSLRSRALALLKKGYIKVNGEPEGGG